MLILPGLNSIECDHPWASKPTLMCSFSYSPLAIPGPQCKIKIVCIFLNAPFLQWKKITFIRKKNQSWKVFSFAAISLKKKTY
jgi:hypothetical protein